MALQVEEMHDSREWKVGKSARFHYKGWNDPPTGVVDEAALRTAVAALAPTTWQGLRRLNDFDIKQSKNIADVQVSYKELKSELEVNLDTGGGSFTRKSSLETIATYPAAGVAAAPDFKGLINVDHDSVEGVEDEVPSFNFQITRSVLDTAVNSFVADMYALTTRVNSSEVTFTIRGWNPTFAAGELYFKQGTGKPKQDSDYWTFTLNFAAEPNVEGEDVPGIGPIDKQGWDYFWIRHVDQDDDVAKSLTRVPEAGYVERVKKRADLNSLFT